MIIFLLLVEIVFIFDVDGDVGLNFHLWRLVWKIYPYMDTLHVWQRRFYKLVLFFATSSKFYWMQKVSTIIFSHSQGISFQFII